MKIKYSRRPSSIALSVGCTQSCRKHCHTLIELAVGESTAETSRERLEAQDPAPALVTISSERLHHIETRIRTLSQMVQTLQGQSPLVGQATRAVDAMSTHTSTSTVPGTARTDSSNVTGHLSIREDGFVRYIEPTFVSKSMGKRVTSCTWLPRGVSPGLKHPFPYLRHANPFARYF